MPKMSSKKWSLPAEDVRKKIAYSVSQAVLEIVQKTDGVELSWLYAHVGSELASMVLGTRYFVQGGTLDVITAPPEGGFLVDAVGGHGYPKEYYSWFSADHGDSDGTDSHDIEVVDLAARHWGNRASKLGVRVCRELPETVWESLADARCRGVSFEADVETTRKVRERADPSSKWFRLIEDVWMRAITHMAVADGKRVLVVDENGVREGP